METSIFIEAENFDNLGGWTVDSQFVRDMGSSYLIAHGMGEQVIDASTVFNVPEAGTYTVWARTKDWVPAHHPGRFDLLVDGNKTLKTLGQSGADWSWENVGSLELSSGNHTLSLHDLTGFDGRIDAIWLTADSNATPPENGYQVNRAWRASFQGKSLDPIVRGAFDVVVVGDGVPACAAALSAARCGMSVALVGNRPVLGGNASREVGLGPRGFKTPLVSSLIERNADGDLNCTPLVEDESGIHVFHNEEVISATKDAGGKIISIGSRNTLDLEESIFEADTFIDASGRAILAKLTGAEIRTGREGKEEFNESLAPDIADEMHHGNTVLFHLGMAGHPVVYKNMEWATEVSKDFSCLAGQMGGLSQDNQPGPCAHEPEPEQAALFAQEAQKKLIAGIQQNHMFPPEEVLHLFPASHFWEYGQYLDMDEPGNEELVRDYLMRALYGTMYNIKAAQPEKYANLYFDWMHIVPARGEYCRIVGDYMVNENDVRDHEHFPDCVCLNAEAFCLHYPGDETYEFRLKKWVWDVRDQKPYEIPFRSLYSKDVPNLMMAGKHISVSRVVSSSVKMMANGANHGIAVGAASSLCKKYGKTPREIALDHMEELQALIQQVQNEKTPENQ